MLIIQHVDVATHGVLSQNFRQWSIEMRGKGLLGSAKPGDIVPSDRSAANNTDDGYQGEACRAQFRPC